jgi:sugar lactone lactonase YvrE
VKTGYWLLIITLLFNLYACIPQSQLIITTAAGRGTLGYGGDGQLAHHAQFNHLRGIALDHADNLYIADVRNHRIRKVNAITGIITTVVGTGIAGYSGDGKLAIQAQLNEPVGVVTDKVGNLYIVDMLNYRIRKVDRNGIITTIAGNGIPGYGGDEGPAITAQINPIYGDITVDNLDNIYLADRDNNCIRKIDKNGIITTVAGNGTIGNNGDGGLAINAQLNFPEDMVLDEVGNLYIADTYNHLIRQVDTKGIITTIAGRGTTGLGDGGPAAMAQFHLPIGIARDSKGNLYVADAEHHRIRQIDTHGKITTVVGTEIQGYSSDGELAAQARLHFPEDVAVDSADNLYIVDKDNHRIRKLIRVTIETNYLMLIVLLTIGSLLLFGISIALYYLRLYRHPLVINLSTDASQLLTTPLEQLPQVKRLLKHTHRLNTVLANNDVSLAWLEKAIAFITMSSAARCALLAKKLGANEQSTDNADIFMLRFNETLPLNLTRCLLYFPSAHLPTTEILLQLQREEMSLQVTIIITLKADQQQALRPYGENLATLWIVPNNRELTTLLLSPPATYALAHLLATQLKIAHISPYQTRGGITKETSFFGRAKILAHIINRTPTNYLIIGGRQLGKSSLLKQIERCYHNHPKVSCHYLVLRDNDLQRSLTITLQLPKNTSLPVLLEKLIAMPNGQYRLLLIDEADRFIRHEMANGYPLLNHFRSLSEEGHCYFILAGFWDLYRAAVLDYHSPIVNFGEHIIIGALETEASWQLATQPMTMLDIRYQSEALVEQILTATGQRANLIAIVGNEMLNNLANNQRLLSQADISQALSSQAILEALAGWMQLTHDEHAARLDRIIVYATVEIGEFKLTTLMQILNENNYSYTTEQLQQALVRLELAFIIRRNHANYTYCVPLFREMLIASQAITVLLQQELLAK